MKHMAKIHSAPRLTEKFWRMGEEPREFELDRLEREMKCSFNPDLRKAARDRYLELTDKEFA